MKLEKVELVVNAEREVNYNGIMHRSCERGREIDLYIDTETGVQYFVMNTSNAGAMCPRYNADGSLYVSVSI